MSEEEQEVKDSNELLNFLLIILGILYLLEAITNFLAFFGIGVPSGVTSIVVSVGTQGFLSTAIGFWCIVAGIGMFREEEWALGQGIMITSILVIDSLAKMISWFGGTAFDPLFFGDWITIIAFIVGLLGFFWLLFTMKRYD